MLYLYHVNNQQYYELVDQLTIGRTTGEIICPDDGRMSGKHAQISMETTDGQSVLYIQDLGSKNYTIVNRAEIQPNKKFRIKTYNLLEIGDQQFVVTETNDVKISDLNELIKKHLSKSLLKLNLEIEIAGPPTTSVEKSPYELLKEHESKILKLQEEILTLKKAEEMELLKLDEAKERVLAKAKAKKAEISQAMATLQVAADKIKDEMAKFKTEIEMKKKKIINLKDIPSDSAEELPE